MGAIVWHAPTGAPVALSNWHVLSNGGTANRTVQPGPNDDGALDRNALGRVLDEVLDQTLDAAISSVDQRGVEGRIAGLGIAVSAAAPAAVGMQVVKSGRATDVTYGVVTQQDKSLKLFYDGVPQMHTLSVLVIEPDAERPSAGPLGADGDSGSCWMLVGDDGEATGTMVGLHVAGDGPAMAYACHADQVFSRLQLEPLGAHDVKGPAASSAGADASVGGQGSPRPLRVIARDGLVLRSGPDASFPRLGLQPYGQTVNVVGTKGDWCMVDLEGDGKADGFMLGSFLQPA